MNNLRESGIGLFSDSAGWRIRCDQFGMSLFKINQLTIQHIVFIITDFGIIFNIVPIVMIIDQFSKLLDVFLGIKAVVIRSLFL